MATTFASDDIGEQAMVIDEATREKEAKEIYTNPMAGDILYTSWGYDQTNVEFFLITRVSAKSVWMVRIGSKVNEETKRLYPDPARVVEDHGTRTSAGEEIGPRRITGSAYRIDNSGYIRLGFAYVGGGAYDTIAAGLPGH